MDYLNYILLALIAFLFIQRMMPTKGVRQITPSGLKNELRDSNKQYVDVRTPGEFKANHIQGFKNIPLNQLPQKSSQLSKDKEVVVICQSGMRSNKATKILTKQGFKKVTNVKGGMSAY
ncbi:rhodanese-related sulfurtransferase [Bacillus ectoiniformans]|uniref:rhodanese-like domain-containing protein n=1 Tax=Bacillus ectoiniformans TaxID=1494429 RepID=UPI001958F054|nr:rhodanese-like domain-containing protein [Bacillus ectoiniformans]MBM7647471.1 rhodanese-related sulfurtransferase [Bacillus ectoiniformans]